MNMEQMMIAILNKLDKIDSRLDSMDARMDYMNEKINLLNQKTDDLRVDMKFIQRSVQKDIAKLQDAQDTLIAVLERKGILKVN